MKFGKQASALVRDIAYSSADNIPQYQDEGVRLVLEEMKEHSIIVQRLATEATEREKARLGRDLEEGETLEWDLMPEITNAMLIHHEAILRDKRMLLIYMNERMSRIQELRWQQRSLPQHVQANLSPSECRYFEKYSRTLQAFMRKDSGVGLDLTLYEVPPRDLQVKVRVMQDIGEVMLSVGPTYLALGSVHSLPRHEVERFLRAGDLEVLDLIRE